MNGMHHKDCRHSTMPALRAQHGLMQFLMPTNLYEGDNYHQAAVVQWLLY